MNNDNYMQDWSSTEISTLDRMQSNTEFMHVQISITTVISCPYVQCA